jgi:hypothetical protein
MTERKAMTLSRWPREQVTEAEKKPRLPNRGFKLLEGKRGRKIARKQFSFLQDQERQDLPICSVIPWFPRL